jgi:NAD dependent epimerase/dehydratase
MKKILITGAGGFIGSHLVDVAISRNYQVTALVKYNSKNNWGWLENHNNKNLKIISGDITNADMMNKLIKGHYAVIHLAALIGIPYSYVAVESYYETNVKGTMNILNSCKSNKTKRILLTSTSEVYGTAKYTPIDENHPLQAQSPYSASKIASDHLGESYFRSFNLPVTIVRPFNAYGPRQSSRAIIPTIITQTLNNYNNVEIGNAKPTRDYNYVVDICNAFLDILETKKTIGETINIASGKEIQIGTLAKKIIKISGKNKKLKIAKKRLRPKKSEVDQLLGENKKIKKLTKWKPKVSFDSGLKKTYEWFKKQDKTASLKSKLYTI